MTVTANTTAQLRQFDMSSRKAHQLSVYGVTLHFHKHSANVNKTSNAWFQMHAKAVYKSQRNA